MKEKHHQHSDAEFLQLFEATAIEAEELSHEAHFRIAWIYLTKFKFEAALRKLTDGIQRFDNKYAGGRKYHATITRAYMLLIDRRMKVRSHETWKEFIAENGDLLKPVDHVLLSYYRRDTLFSEEARNNYLEPDKEKVN